MKRVKNLFSINPIIVKEVRSRMRGPRAFITMTIILLVMGGMLFAMLQIIMATARYTSIMSPQVGQSLFAALAFLELFLVCAITPAVTAGAISSEKEKQTYEMLMATPLSPTRVLWGKLVSALSYVFLLLFAGVPLASMVFIFGGVAPGDMIKVLLVLLVVAVTFGMLGLFMSALFGRTGRATVASFVLVIAMMFGPLFLAVLVAALRQGEPPRWILTPSPISALSAALAPSMGSSTGVELFYGLSGIFNMGVSPVSQNGIPRPLYHYSIPFFMLLTLVLYLLSTRLVQPTRRWSMSRRQVLVGIGAVVLMLVLLGGAFAATTGRYEQVRGQAVDQINTNVVEGPMFGPVPGVAVAEERVVVAEPGMDPTPTPIPPPGAVILEDAAQAEIYAAVARQLYTVDHTFGDKAPNWPALYLVSVTNDGVGDPNAAQGDPLLLGKPVLSGVATALNDLPAKVMWIESPDAAPKDPRTGEVENGNGAVITFGRIYPQDESTVHVSASLYFSSMGAAGKTYVLTLIDGKWAVTGTTGAEWIS